MSYTLLCGQLGTAALCHQANFQVQNNLEGFKPLRDLNFLSASGSSDPVVPEQEKLYMEGQVIQKFECQPVGMCLPGFPKPLGLHALFLSLKK